MLRWIAILLALAGLGLGLYDLGAWAFGDSEVMRPGAPLFTAVGALWASLHRDSLLLLQPAVERHLSPALWDHAIQPLLESPAAIVLLAVAGIVGGLALLFRPRRRRTLLD
jgi:hypothetical protein